MFKILRDPRIYPNVAGRAHLCRTLLAATPGRSTTDLINLMRNIYNAVEVANVQIVPVLRMPQ